MKNQITERLAELDAEAFRSAAAWAANRLRDAGSAVVYLAPGDMTEYRISIVAPTTYWAYGDERQGKYYWVALCASFGAGYEWPGGSVSTRGTAAWTGAVIARFLTELSAEIHAGVPA